MYVELDKIKEKVVNGLTTELKNDENFDVDLLNAKVEAVILEIQAIRNYPPEYSADMIALDMERYLPTIRSVALYDYNQIGVEFQSGSTENGISRTYVNRNRLFNTVRPLAVII
jgi:hypothetical protein